MIPDAQIGKIRIKIFNSSTCVTVQSLHELVTSPHSFSASDITAALSRNLDKVELSTVSKKASPLTNILDTL